MTSRLLLTGFLVAPIVRRSRREDGRHFGVAAIRDDVSGEPRSWTVFVNDVALIEPFEKLYEGEPIAVSGPFSVKFENNRVIYRITADSLVAARKERKKRQKPEAADSSINPDDAPRDNEQRGYHFDDPLPF